MTNLSVFSFNSNDVRTFADSNGEPWFLANDVCAILGYRNARDAISKHCKDRGVAKRDTGVSTGKKANGDDATQNVEMTYINEPNLYRLIIKSRKPEAEAFEAHVMEVILPTIRKTGSYTAPERKTKQVLIGKLTADQQDAIKALVNSRIDSVPKEKQRGTAMKLWGAINRKFGTKTYKDIDPSEFINVLSLVSRLPLEGELMPRNEAPAIPEGMVLVRKDLLEETNNMIKMIDERFTLLEHAEKEMTYFHDMMQILTSSALVKANQAIREARYRLIDPIKHAKSYTGLMLN